MTRICILCVQDSDSEEDKKKKKKKEDKKKKKKKDKVCLNCPVFGRVHLSSFELI